MANHTFARFTLLPPAASRFVVRIFMMRKDDSRGKGLVSEIYLETNSSKPHSCTHTHTHAYTHAFTQPFTHILPTCIHTHLYIYHTHTHVHTHAYTYSHAYTLLRTCTAGSSFRSLTTTQPQRRSEEQFKAPNEKKQKQNDVAKAGTSKPFH